MFTHVKRPCLYALFMAFIFLCAEVNVIAGEPLQGRQISISVKKKSLSSILYEISKKSGITIYFSDSDLVGFDNIDYEAKEREVTEILGELFKGRGLEYEVISEKHIGVKKVREKVFSFVGERDTLLTVSGKVTDEKGVPVVGATVLVKGTPNGVATNKDGMFEVEARSNSLLAISSIGFVSQEVVVNRRTSVGVVKLEELVNVIDETVVIAYGTTTKRLNPGNIVSIKAEEIATQPVTNPLYALQGRVAGLQVTPTTGIAGGSVDLKIRGKNTLRTAEIGSIGNAEPLIVIDGLPITNNVPGLGGELLGLSQFSSLTFLNPNDIESIDVLKDADATSIYGSRGANGVILVTTKKAKENKTTINLAVENGFSSNPKKMRLLQASDYLRYRQQAYRNSNYNIDNAPFTQTNADVKLWSSKRNIDWQDVLLGKTASYGNYQITLSAGNQNLSYNLSGNYHRETTVFPGDNVDHRGNFRFSTSAVSPNNRLKSTVTANYFYNKSNYPGVDFTRTALTLPPNAPELYKIDGSLNWEPLPSGSSSWDNPLALLLRSYNSTVTNLITSLDLGYDITSSLSFKTQISYNQLDGKSFKINLSRASSSPELMNAPISSDFPTSEARNISIEPQLNYNNTLLNGDFKILVGGSFQQSSTESQTLSADGFSDDQLIRNLQAATNFLARNTSSQYKYAAIFSRISYNLKNRYIVNISARRDGSSRFGPGKQFGNFGSIGSAWIFSEESFFKDLNSMVSFGKVRFSYGSTGNDGIGDYAYLERYTPIEELLPYQGVRGYRTAGIYNPDYAWEITRKMEAGIEIGVNKDRVFFTVSGYRNRSSNQLLNYSFPSISGPGSPIFNLPALIENKGLEVTLQSQNIKQNFFSWSTSFNVSLNRNKLVRFPNLENSQYYSFFEVGEPFAGVTKLYKSAGVDKNTGQYQFQTVDGKITTTPEDPSRLDGGKYLRVLTDPKYFGGISNSLRFGSVKIEIFFQFTKQMGVNPLVVNTVSAGFLGNVPVELLDYWTKPGDNTKFQKPIGRINGDLMAASERLNISDFAIVDASFVRLKNLSISYSLNPRFCKNIKVSTLRIYALAQNLFTLTSYKGLDPETQSVNNVPPLRTITAGIQLIL